MAGSTKKTSDSVVFGIGNKTSWMKKYPSTNTFRTLLKKNYDSYWEANQEGKEGIIQGILDRFLPDAFFRLVDGELSPLDKKLAKNEVKMSMAYMRSKLKEKKRKMRNKEQEQVEGTPCADDLVFHQGVIVGSRNYATLKFEEMLLLHLARLRNTEGKICLKKGGARSIARRILQQQKEENPGQKYFKYVAGTNKYFKYSEEQAFVRAVTLVETVQQTHNRKIVPLEKRCLDHGIDLSEEKEQDADTTADTTLLEAGNDSSLQRGHRKNRALHGTKRNYAEVNVDNANETDGSKHPFRRQAREDNKENEDRKSNATIANNDGGDDNDDDDDSVRIVENPNSVSPPVPTEKKAGNVARHPDISTSTKKSRLEISVVNNEDCPPNHMIQDPSVAKNKSPVDQDQVESTNAATDSPIKQEEEQKGHQSDPVLLPTRSDGTNQTEENHQSKPEFKELQDENAELKDENAELKRRLAILQNQKDAQSIEIEDLQSEVNVLRREKAKEKLAHKKKVEEVDALEQHCEEMEEELNQMRMNTAHAQGFSECFDEEN
ncbi:unnamed protein product [Cylindrotheca closterium]|uniref:Uncharacterized protein n=1 Tax=Cylindrotheca closterium TaxID=2856 RepID=A0AAD2FYM1_9STRA|nr:unnamed protein product [Cylindrotheca closterium]